MSLTPRQKKLIDFVAEYVQEHGYSPSYEEIANGLELSSLATVHKHIAALEKKSYLRRNYNHSRSIEIAPQYMRDYKKSRGEETDEPRVPLAGRIAAGSPVEAIPSTESLSFSDFVDNPQTYALEVRGDSMIEDHICNGDYVLVQRATSVRNGEIIVAVVDGTEATLKRFYLEPEGKVRLQPANSSMEPIVVNAGQVEVQGRVLAVLRKFH